MDVRGIAQQVLTARKRELAVHKKGAKDKGPSKLVPPEEPIVAEQRHADAQREQDQAIKDLLLGLSKELRANTKKVEESLEETAKTNKAVMQLTDRVGDMEVS